MSRSSRRSLALLVSCRSRTRRRTRRRSARVRAGDVGVVGGDDRQLSGLPTDGLNADGTRTSRPRRPTSGPTCGARSRRGGWGSSSERELTQRLTRTLTRSSTWSATAARPGLNWYDHRTGAKLTDWPPQPDQNFHPILSSVDNGWLAVGLKIVENGVPRLSRARGALYDAMDFGFYYRPDVNRVLFHFRPDDPPPHRAATTPSSARAGSSTTSASRAGSCRRRSTTGAGARSRTPATTGSRRRSRSATTRTYYGVAVFEGAYPYAGTRSCRRGAVSMFEALMPALFVPEETWAPQQLGRQPPADGAGADPPRPDRGRLRLLGLLAREQARGRLRRLGRRRRRHGSERRCRPTRTTRSSTTASRAARTAREARPAAVGVHERRRHAARRVPRAALRAARDARRTSAARPRLPRPVRKWGFRDSVNVQTGASRTPTCRSTRG